VGKYAQEAKVQNPKMVGNRGTEKKPNHPNLRPGKKRKKTSSPEQTPITPRRHKKSETRTNPKKRQSKCNRNLI
jgi:hypothetical protein